jgi:hypothetical protein
MDWVDDLVEEGRILLRVEPDSPASSHESEEKERRGGQRIAQRGRRHGTE